MFSEANVWVAIAVAMVISVVLIENINRLDNDPVVNCATDSSCHLSVSDRHATPGLDKADFKVRLATSHDSF